MEVYKIKARKQRRYGTSKYKFPKYITYHNYYNYAMQQEYDRVLVSAILVFLTEKYIIEKTRWQRLFYNLFYLIIEPNDNIVLMNDGRFVVNKRNIRDFNDYYYYLEDFYLDFDNNILYHSDEKDGIMILKRKIKIEQILKRK